MDCCKHLLRVSDQSSSKYLVPNSRLPLETKRHCVSGHRTMAILSKNDALADLAEAETQVSTICLQLTRRSCSCRRRVNFHFSPPTGLQVSRNVGQ